MDLHSEYGASIKMEVDCDQENRNNSYSPEMDCVFHGICSDAEKQMVIEKQAEIIAKLREEIKLLKSKKSSSNKQVTEMGIQTDDNWPSTSIGEMAKEVAQDALSEMGYAYEATSGLYYDYKTGYYYDPASGLYYDGKSGTYYFYHKDSKTFHFHSKVEMADMKSDKKQYKKKRKNKRVNDVDEVTKKGEHSLSVLRVSDLLSQQKHSKVKLKDSDEDDGRGEESDKEEGECSDISAIDVDTEGSSTSEESGAVKELEFMECAKAWPPCMRIIVRETNLKELEVGKLFIITCAGGTLGREGDHAILIPDMNISKYHAKFSFDNTDEKNEKGNYTLTDLGSRNGTYVGGKRLSTALQESDPFDLAHDTTIRIGGTTLLCHIHCGQNTCQDCEPGLLRSNVKVETNFAPQTRAETLKELKKKFGLKGCEYAAQTVSLPTGYKDRAENRRQVVGSLHEHEKTETASVDQAITVKNKGFKMLSKMGWKTGDALGKSSQDGIVEPVLVEQRVEKLGLGYDKPVPPSALTSAVDKKKQEIWKKARSRYNKIVTKSANGSGL